MDNHDKVNHILEILALDSIREAIANDLKNIGKIAPNEVWKLGTIKPGKDKIWKPEYAGSYFVPSRMAMLNPRPQSRFLHNTITIATETTQWTRSTAYDFKIVHKENNLVSIRDDVVINNNKLSLFLMRRRVGEFVPLPQFLRDKGFPVGEKGIQKDDPFSTVANGVIVQRTQGNMSVIHPKLLAQRTLIDDEGKIIYLGIDEETVPRKTIFVIRMRAAEFENFHQLFSHQRYKPILWYHSFPTVSDRMLAIWDAPLTSNLLSELVIDPRGKAKLFIPKEKANWQEFMNSLLRLWLTIFASKGNELLAFFKDKDCLNDYLEKKEKILRAYYLIEDFMFDLKKG